MTPTKEIEAVKTAQDGPSRIQRRRTKGYRLPEGALYIGRGSKWGNPYVVKLAPKGMVGAWPQTDHRYAVIDTRPNAPRGNYQLFKTFHDATRYAIRQYRYVRFNEILGEDPNALQELAGRDLACWCAETNECHGDFLLAKANGYQA